MCTPHVRVNTQQYTTVLELLEEARQAIIKTAEVHSPHFQDALDAQLAVQSAIIHLEVCQEHCSFASGYTDPGVQAAKDELTLITHRREFSGADLPVEVSPEIAYSVNV